MCGTQFYTTQSNIDRGRGKHCSRTCAGKNSQTRHGHTTKNSASRTYLTWINMVRRCTKEKSTKYKSYGTKGITVDQKWMDFSFFLQDMGERPEGKTLDRIDGKKGYSKDNCRWATPTEQANNIKTNRIVYYDGQNYTLQNLARDFGLKPMTLSYRIDAGWPENEWSSAAIYADKSRNKNPQIR